MPVCGWSSYSFVEELVTPHLEELLIKKLITIQTG
jgi:hypothetical protein